MSKRDKSDSGLEAISDGVNALVAAGTSATIEGALGVLTGGVVGSLAGTALLSTAKMLKERFLGSREEHRIALGIGFAGIKVSQMIATGHQVRDDGFFDQVDNRSTGEEIIEGALLAVQGEYEEKKVKHIAYLLAGICFDSKLDRGKANFLLREAKALSYRQYLLLRLISSPAEYGVAYDIDLDKLKDKTAVDSIYFVPFDLVQETKSLRSRGLLKDDQKYLSESSFDIGLLELTWIGRRLVELLQLQELDSEDLEYVANSIRH